MGLKQEVEAECRKLEREAMKVLRRANRDYPELLKENGFDVDVPKDEGNKQCRN